MITILAIAVVLVQRIVKVNDLVLLPLYWSDCEPPNCLNFPESVKLPPTNVEASGDVLAVRQLHLKWEGIVSIIVGIISSFTEHNQSNSE